MAQVHGKAGKATYLKGDRLLHWTLFPMLSMGFLTYVLFRMKSAPARPLQFVVGCMLFGFGCWCAADVFSLEAAADRYYGGADGEQDVGLVLSRLPQEFHIFNGLGFEGGDVDHIIVGPTGVFVIETKNHGGTISQRGHRLCRNGIPLGHDFVRQAECEAMYVKRRLGPQVLCHVRPVVVFARAKVRVRARIDGVKVISLTSLADTVTQRTTCLSHGEVRRCVQCLETAQAPAINRDESGWRMPSAGFARVPPVGATHPGFVQLVGLGRTATRVPERRRARP